MRTKSTISHLLVALQFTAIFGKMHREETHLHQKFADYANYAKHTHRLLPRIY